MANDTTAQKDKAFKGTVTNPATDAAVREKLVTARIALLLKAPFFGNLATRLQLINADDWCPTAATDGRKFYYNSEFINKLPQKQLEFLVGHEVLHVVYDHMGRRGDRDAQLYNVAADYCVNADLKAQRIGEFIPSGLYDKKYEGWSSEEVYDDLYQNAEKIDLQSLIDQLIDEHLDDEDEGAGEGEGEGGDKQGKGGRPKLSDEEKKQIRDEIKEAVMAAAQACQAGQLPSGVARLIKDLTAPQLDWRTLLQQQIQSTMRTDYTWMRASRKGWDMDAVMPGADFDKEIDICVSIDASGSMSDAMLRDILGEVKGIMESYTTFRLHLWSFDTQVYNATMFTAENLDDIMEWSPGGGGGTAFLCNWEYMREHDIQPKKFVMFTDGYYSDSWGDPDYCDTLFVVHGGNKEQADFGITTYYEFEKSKSYA